MDSFYSQILQKAHIPKDTSILVVCGGELDREVLLSNGFTSVTISNLDERVRGDEFAPFSWSFQDAEQLSFGDATFDYVLVHAGLHHCASPHRALLEMYRVARRGILAFEARDSLLMKVAKAMNTVPSYEAAAVRSNEYRWGGVRNSCVPNYIYAGPKRKCGRRLQAMRRTRPIESSSSMGCCFRREGFRSNQAGSFAGFRRR
ncbi:MAG: methyltransferase domain-containing protein [Acidobacteriaceae bacterium]